MHDHNPEWTRCTAVRRDGKFCDGESLPDAPFPICIKHASRLLAYLNDYAPSGLGSRIIVAARAVDQARAVAVERTARKPSVGHVYYVQIGKYIKIGHTSNLGQRLASYPPDARLLALEVGTPSLERQRHREFADDLLDRNEWFRPSPRLLAHIRKIKEARAA